MKILSVVKPEVEPTKIVNYFGEQFTVPEWVKYLAMDKCGNLFGYESKPFLAEDVNMYLINGYLNREGKYIARIVYDGDWKESLVEV